MSTVIDPNTTEAAEAADAPLPLSLAREIGALSERLRVRVGIDVEASRVLEKELEATGQKDFEKLTAEQGERFAERLSELLVTLPQRGFSRERAEPFVPIKLGFPQLWPHTAQSPLTLKLEYLLSEDADGEQTAFVMLSDEEQAEETYRYDCRLLSLLVCRVPEGFMDFPAVEADDAGAPVDAEGFKQTLFDYFFVQHDEARAKPMRFIVRMFMKHYWQKIMPHDYL